MSTLTIRNLSPELIQRLKADAVAHKRSMEQEVREILSHHLACREEVLDEVMTMWPKIANPPTADQITDWIKAGRGRLE